MANLRQFLITDSAIEFDYTLFFSNFIEKFENENKNANKKHILIQTLNEIKKEQNFVKQFEFDFKKKFPDDVKIIKEVLSDSQKKDKTLIDTLDDFFNQNYPGIFYNQIQGINYYNENKKLDTETMFLMMRNENILVDEKTVKRYLKSPKTIYHFNPIKEIFKQLPKWDGVNHVKRLTDLFDVRENIPGIKRRKFIETQTLKYFVRMLYQLFDKGMKNINKLSLFLLSPKGSGKTTFIKTKIFPQKLLNFMTEGFSFDRKDNNSKMTMCNSFIVFIDEHNGFANQKHNVSYKGINDFKFFSGNDGFDIIRAGQKDSRKRIANFIFTANPDTFHGIHEDSLINRYLFLDFKNSSDNLLPFDKWTEEDTNQMWAQIYDLYKNNFDAQLTQEEQHQLNIINETYCKSVNDLQTFMNLHIKPGTPQKGQNYTAEEITEILKNTSKLNDSIKISINSRNIGRKINQIYDIKKVYDGTKTTQRAYRLIIDI